MVMRRRESSDSDEEEADVVGQNETLTTGDDDVKEQYSDDTLPARTINDLPDEILLMILKKVDLKGQLACRIVNRRISKVIDGHNLIHFDKPKNCYSSYYSKKGKKVTSLFIGELESEEEVAALRRKIQRIQYPLAVLKSVTIDWKELWGQSTFNDSFLFGGLGVEATRPEKLILKANKIGERRPQNLVKVFNAFELTLDIEEGLNASNIEQLIQKLCSYWGSAVICPRGQPLAPFMDAIREINSKWCRTRYHNGIIFTPRIGVVAESSDDFHQIMPQKREKLIKLCHLEVTIMDKEQASYFHQIFTKSAKCLKSLKITMATGAGVKDKPLLSVCPAMSSLKKLELIVVGPWEDEKGRILPPLVKFRQRNDLVEDGFVKKTLFPSLKQLCIRPPVVTDDKKWDDIYRVYYKNFLFVRQPDDDSPLSKWSRGLESLELVFPPKGNNSKFGGDKYQRFCLELTKIFKLTKARDTNDGEEVDLSRFK